MSSTNTNNPAGDPATNSGPSTAIAAAAPAPSNTATAGNSTMTNNTTAGPGEILLTERFLTDPSWPGDLVLDLDKSNWPVWSRRLRLLAIGQGFGGWLNGTLPCPDATTHPKAHWIWRNNDDSVRAFIIRNISAIDEQYLGISADTAPSHTLYETLRKRHEQLGAYAQAIFIKQALQILLNHNTSISQKIMEIQRLHQQIVNIGPINSDQLLTVFLINAMGDQFQHLQSRVQAMTKDPNFSSNDIISILLEEEALIKRRTEQGLGPTSESSALVTTSTPTNNSPNRSSRNRPTCGNCKRVGHATEYCVRRGGKMAGKTIEDAREAQRAAQGKVTNGYAQTGNTQTTVTTSAHIAVTSTDHQTAYSPCSYCCPSARPSGRSTRPTTCSCRSHSYCSRSYRSSC
jgi:gag-polypeptide of LTR copia-type